MTKEGHHKEVDYMKYIRTVFKFLLVYALSPYDLQFSILSPINCRIKSCFIFDN